MPEPCRHIEVHAAKKKKKKERKGKLSISGEQGPLPLTPFVAAFWKTMQPILKLTQLKRVCGKVSTSLAQTIDD